MKNQYVKGDNAAKSSNISDATGARNKIAGKISPATQVISVPIQEISQMIGEFLLPTSVISQIPQIIFERASEFSKVVWGFSEITREISENSRIIFGFSSTFFVLATDISHFPSTTCAFFTEPASKIRSFLPRPRC